MTTGEQGFRVQVLLSIQRALWDMVTPTLRASRSNARRRLFAAASCTSENRLRKSAKLCRR